MKAEKYFSDSVQQSGLKNTTQDNLIFFLLFKHSLTGFVYLLVGCFTSQQHASLSQRRICPDKFTSCHTKIKVADQTVYLTPSQYSDTGPTSPSPDPITPGACQGSHWSADFQEAGMTEPGKIPTAQAGIKRRIFCL